MAALSSRCLFFFAFKISAERAAGRPLGTRTDSGHYNNITETSLSTSNCACRGTHRGRPVSYTAQTARASRRTGWHRTRHRIWTTEMPQEPASTIPTTEDHLLSSRDRSAGSRRAEQSSINICIHQVAVQAPATCCATRAQQSRLPHLDRRDARPTTQQDPGGRS